MTDEQREQLEAWVAEHGPIPVVDARGRRRLTMVQTREHIVVLPSPFRVPSIVEIGEPDSRVFGVSVWWWIVVVVLASTNLVLWSYLLLTGGV